MGIFGAARNERSPDLRDGAGVAGKAGCRRSSLIFRYSATALAAPIADIKSAD
jgi:hypothetical protein